MEKIKKIRNAKALAWVNKSDLLIYKKSSFYIYNIETESFAFVSKMLLTKKQLFLSKFHLLRRLFRIYPQSPSYSSLDNSLYFSFYGYVYSLNINDAKITRELKLNHNAKRVLSFFSADNGDVFFGEYPTSNTSNEGVSIYQKNKSCWKKVYEFANNSIRHIHHITACDDKMYCFTGDEDSEICIKMFNIHDFTNNKTIAAGEQKYRSCLGLIVSGGREIYYLTDTPYIENKLYKLNTETSECEDICSIEGTVIYGLIDSDKMYFSTVVEYNLAKTLNGENKVISINGIDGGIKSKYSHVYCFDLKNKTLEKIFSLKKDALSIKYFGLGTFIFTANPNSDYLAFTSSSLKKDETIFVFKK